MSRSRDRRRSPYAPLAALLTAHPQVARHLKHRRSPDRYEYVRITVASNPVRGCHVYGIYVVELKQLAAMERGHAVDYLMVQDFFVYYAGGGRTAKLTRSPTARSSLVGWLTPTGPHKSGPRL